MSFRRNFLSAVGRELKLFRSFGGSVNRGQLQEAVQVKEIPVSAEWENAEPFEAIPGPKPLPIPMGNVWRFLPFGTFYKMDLDQLYTKLYKEYGPIIRLSGIVAFEDMVVLFSATDTEKMFRNESTMPIRNGLKCLDYYKNVLRKDWFGGYPGLLSTQGEEWYQFRKIVNQPMIQPKSAKMYIQPIGNVADCFIERMKKLRDENLEMPENYLQELEKWALESIGVIALDTRFGCLEENLPPESEALQLVKSVKTLFDSFYLLETQLSPWKIVWTPTYQKFVDNMDTVCTISKKYINNKWEEIKKMDPEQRDNNSVLENILLRSDNTNIAFTMAMDMILAGIDTTSSIVANVLYFLAKNPEKQEKLYAELREIMPEKNHSLTESELNEARYLKACIKETHRISPIVIGTQRVMVKDMVLSNYRVPKNTPVVCHNMMMCRQERYFKQADKYIPERWLKNEEESSSLTAEDASSFVLLPFGFGPRMCIGRRFAELEVQILTAKIIRNFKLSYNHGDMKWKAWILRSVNKPLKFKMDDRQ